MLIPFMKMHAQGNDFVILDGFSVVLPKLDYPALAQDMCARHTGVGADGLVLISPRKTASAQMIIYNSDGSLAEMCGSALRCVAWIMYGKLKKRNLTILTESGIKQADISSGNPIISVNLGMPQLLRANYTAEGFNGDLVDAGNHHFVIWTDSPDPDLHLINGATIEQHSDFPQPVNVHFAHLISPEEISIKIWEHGCGATRACGTGAASCVFSGMQRGLLSKKVKINMPGGSVQIELTDSGCILSGEVSHSFSGSYQWRT